MDAAAAMSEQKPVKQAFVLATLVSTIAGTFITGINLYDRLVEQRRQKKLDRGQNKRIKELESRLNQATEERAKMREERDDMYKNNKAKNTTRENHGNGDGDDGHDNGDENRNLRNSLERSGPQIQREYDRFYQNMGQKFANGDLVAQTQLQSQVIVLQGTVIKLLEEALMTGNPPDLSRLYNTSEFAREGSIRALQDQYQRFLQSAPIQHRRRPAAPLRRTSSTPSLRGDDIREGSDVNSSSRFSQPRYHHPPPSQAPHGRKALPAPGSPLFCRYAERLQRSSEPLECELCPACGVILLGSPGHGRRESVPQSSSSSSWRIEKEVVLKPRRRGRSPSRDRSRNRHQSHCIDGFGSGEGEEIATRSFILTPRFVAKCHRPDSGLACYLCFCHRDSDTLCRTEEALVSHVAGKHSIAEYGQDSDIREMSRTLPYR